MVCIQKRSDHFFVCSFLSRTNHLYQHIPHSLATVHIALLAMVRLRREVSGRLLPLLATTNWTTSFLLLMSTGLGRVSQLLLSMTLRPTGRDSMRLDGMPLLWMGTALKKYAKLSMMLSSARINQPALLPRPSRVRVSNVLGYL